MIGSLRAIRKPTAACWRHTPFRGGATYEYRQNGDADGPNYRLIHFLTQELHKLQVFHKRGTSKVKTAIEYLHGLEYAIETAKDVNAIPAVGPEIANKMLIFLGRTSKEDLNLVNREEERNATVVRELQTIQGIGPIKARALVRKGCMSIRQLSEPRYLEMLSPAVQKSLQYVVEDATRQEVETFMSSFHKTLNSDFESYLTGSYRREQKTIPSIELLLFHPSYAINPVISPPVASNSHHRNPSDQMLPPPHNLLHDVLEPLRQKGILITLRVGHSKWQGLYKVQQNGKDEFRSLNISLMPQVSKAAALLASTGDEEFIRTCCVNATKNKMFLNEYGLFRRKLQSAPEDYQEMYATDADETAVKSKHGPNASSDWEFVNTPDEAALLHELGMGYIIPKRRNFANLLGQGHSSRGKSQAKRNNSVSSARYDRQAHMGKSGSKTQK